MSNDYLLFGSSSLSFFRGSSIGTGVAINGSTFRIVGNTWRSSDGNVRIFRNGTQSYSGTFASGTLITGGGTLAIAGEQDGVNSGYQASQAHQGDFTEIIIYDVVLNTARRKIVDNYLSAKYNIAISNDLFAYDSPGNFEHGVAGIGRDDSDNFHRDAKGPARVRINTPSSMDDGDFLIWGHDSADFTADPLDTIDVPAGVHNRLSRIWRVDETGDIGTVTIDFDVADFTIGNSNDLVLLIDTDDGSFDDASQTAISSFAGDVATFNNVNFADGNWFTIGSTSSSNPLPITLLNFKADVLEATVALSWATASEINSDFFTVERSRNGRAWESVTEIKAAGISKQLLSYSALDLAPFNGTSYYRLKLNDLDGSFTYSALVEVELEESESPNIIIYPNPTNSLITIASSAADLGPIQVFDVQGRNVTKDISILKSSSQKLVLDLSPLDAGTYLIKTKTTTKKVHKQ